MKEDDEEFNISQDGGDNIQSKERHQLKYVKIENRVGEKIVRTKSLDNLDLNNFIESARDLL